MRSEWYGYHFPELIKIVSDNSMYCRVARLISNRKELSEESLEGLEEVVMDSAKAQAILDASRSSMGQWEGGGTQMSFVCEIQMPPCPFFAHLGPIIVPGDNTGGQSSSLINL